MNTNQVIGLTLAGCAVVLGVCYWVSTRSTQANKEPTVTEGLDKDTKHFDYVTEQWNKARDSVKSGEIEIDSVDEFYRHLHKQLEGYINSADFVMEELREQLHTKNALYLSDLV